MESQANKKKILHVINISFVINHFFGNQFTHFSEKGYQFYVACSGDDLLFDEARRKGFTPFAVPVLRSINPVQDVKSILKLYKFIKREKIDIVIAHSPKGGLLGMIASFMAGVKTRVFFRHGLVFETASPNKRRLLIAIEKITGMLATKVVNVSQSIIDVSNKFALNAAHKNILLGRGTCSGVDTKRFRPRAKINESFVVGYVGRLCKDKGIEELIAAWVIFSLNKVNIELHLIGPLDERDELSPEAIEAIHKNPTIKHFGLIKDTGPYYNQMDVFILPSYREGFGMVILEASASSVPVITTRKTGCINAIEENKTGIFTEINETAIAEAITFYYANPDIRHAHGYNGVQFVQDYFTEEVIFEEIESKVFN